MRGSKLFVAQFRSTRSVRPSVAPWLVGMSCRHLLWPWVVFSLTRHLTTSTLCRARLFMLPKTNEINAFNSCSSGQSTTTAGSDDEDSTFHRGLQSASFSARVKRTRDHFDHFIAHFLHGDENETTDDQDKRSIGKGEYIWSFRPLYRSFLAWRQKWNNG